MDNKLKEKLQNCHPYCDENCQDCEIPENDKEEFERFIENQEETEFIKTLQKSVEEGVEISKKEVNIKEWERNECVTMTAEEADKYTLKSIDKPHGLRYNKGKNRTDLLPFDTIWHISKVLEVGSKKYADRNWELGMSWMSVVGCLMRHLIKFVSGNDIDKETGLPHIDLVMINAIFLSRYFRMNKDFDDRPKNMEKIED